MAAVVVLAAVTATACSRPPPAPLVVDVGHSPDAPGAEAASGATEHAFNRRFAGRLATRLTAAGVAAVRTVGISGPDPLLDRRVGQVAALRPCLLLSVHHDSVQARYLQRHVVGGADRSYTGHAAGFSLFVPTATPAARDSLLAARAIADALIATGETPSLHHAEPIDGENRELLDAGRGIYDGTFLKILRTATAPAVLLEVGVIKNPAEELRLSDAETIDLLADAIAAAVADLPLCTVIGPRT